MIHQHNIDQESIAYDMDQIVIELHYLARALYAQQELKNNNCDNLLSTAHDRLRSIAQDLSVVTKDLKTASRIANVRANN